MVDIQPKLGQMYEGCMNNRNNWQNLAEEREKQKSSNNCKSAIQRKSSRRFFLSPQLLPLLAKELLMSYANCLLAALDVPLTINIGSV